MNFYRKSYNYTFKQTMQHFDLILIRHAQSKINQVTRAIAQKYNIPNTYNYLRNYPQWTHDVKYSYNFIDCSLSQGGIEQCKKARKKADGISPDVILVSPLERTLETCNLLFGDRGIPIFVQPILIESMRSSSDFPTEIASKIGRYPQYNFDSVLKQGQFWCLKYDEQNWEKYMKKIEEKGANTFEQKNKAVFEYMQQNLAYETPKNVRKRIKKIKQMLRTYRQKYNTILVVAHFNIINYSTAKQFDENNEPKNSLKIHNCQFHYTNLSQIEQYS